MMMMMNRVGRQRSNYYLSRSFLASANFLRCSSRWSLVPIRIERAFGDSCFIPNRKSMKVNHWQWLRYSSSEQKQQPTTTMRIVQQTDNPSPMERIMKAWAEEATNTTKKSSVAEEFQSISHILAWTKAFQESTYSLSSPSSKRLKITSNPEESTSITTNDDTTNNNNDRDATHLQPSTKDTNTTHIPWDMLTLLKDSSTSLTSLSSDTLTFLLRSMAQHSVHLRPIHQQGWKSTDIPTKRLKDIEDISSLLLLTLQSKETNPTLLISSWNAWIQCLVDEDTPPIEEEDTNELSNPKVKADAMIPVSSAVIMAQQVLQSMIHSTKEVQDVLSDETSTTTTSTTTIYSSPKFQIYNEFIRNTKNNTYAMPLPNIETFNAVMEHVARDSLHESRRWTTAKQVFHWIQQDEDRIYNQPTSSTVITTPPNATIRTFQLLFQSMPTSTSIKTKQKYLNQLNRVLQSTAFQSYTTLHSLDFIDLFNGCMVPQDTTDFYSKVVPISARKTKKATEEARLIEEWVQFMMDSQSQQLPDNNNEEDEGRKEINDIQWMIPPPNVTSYECVIHAWIRTGTLTGLLRAQEWFSKLLQEHIRHTCRDEHSTQNNDKDGTTKTATMSHWYKPTVETIYPILFGWANFFEQQPDVCQESIQESFALATPLVVEDWILKLYHDKTNTLLNSAVMSTPILAWRNFVRNQNHLDFPMENTYQKSSVEKICMDTKRMAMMRCIEWIDTMESLDEGDCCLEEEQSFTVHPSAYAYTIDAIASTIVTSHDDEAEEEGIQCLFKVMDMLSINIDSIQNDGGSTKTTFKAPLLLRCLPLLYAQCIHHLNPILQRRRNKEKQHQLNDNDTNNIEFVSSFSLDNELLFRVEKMLYSLTDGAVKRAKIEGGNPVSKLWNGDEHALLAPPRNDCRFDTPNLPWAFHPPAIDIANHHFHVEMLKYLKSPCSPHQRGDRIRLLMYVVERLVSTPSDTDGIESSTEIWKEILSCIGVIVVHQVERAEILENVYKKLVASNSKKVDLEGLEDSVKKAMGKTRLAEDLIEKLRLLHQKPTIPESSIKA